MPPQLSPTAPVFPDWKAGSPKQQQLNLALLNRVQGRAHDMLEALVRDREVDLYLSYANAVSVRRLGYNDHGPIHARITTYNALKILGLLHDAGVRTSLEIEEVATYEDSQIAVGLGCFLHDVGMGVTREDHEWHSIVLADPIVQRYLEVLYPPGDPMRVVLRALVHEIIIGHMAHSRIFSIEAGIVLVADGSDMSRGRSRIPAMLGRDPAVGDIHRFSASSIERVDISAGEKKPVRITVRMVNATGLFQIEEVLMTKIKASPILPYLELCALVADDPPRFYLQ